MAGPAPAPTPPPVAPAPATPAPAAAPGGHEHWTLPGPPPATGSRSIARTILRAPIAAQTWRNYLYLLAMAPLAMAAFVMLAVGAWVGGLLSAILVGIPVLAGLVLVAREYGAVPRALARALLGEAVAAPRRRRPKSPGFFSWLWASLGDLDGWRAVAYIVVSFPVTVVGAYVAIVSMALSITLATYPLWWALADPQTTDLSGRVRDSGMQWGSFYFDTWPRALFAGLIGVVGLLAVPWVARVFTTVDRLLVRGLLGPTKISHRLDTLEVTRAHAVDDSAATLRRIERDLHDGTQARLVALAMHLDMAKEKLDGDDTGGVGVRRARELLEAAHRDATEAIAELREVTRSIHPPALDRGLDAALATLAARSGVPATVDTRLAQRPSPAIETIAYFCAAELLTNVAKHSGAGRATVEVSSGGGRLHLRVTDDGTGGARTVEGGGLAGLVERVRTVDGWLTLSSPEGGPTVATVDLPLGV